MTTYHDAEWWQFLASDKLISHHVGTTNLKPTLKGVVLAWNQYNLEFGFAFCRTIPSRLCIQVVTHDTVLHLAHDGIGESSSRITANAGLETLRGCQIHVLRIGHRRTVHDIVIGKRLVDVLIHLDAPDTIAIALHRQGLGQNLCCQQYLLRLGGLHAEDHTVVFILRRDDGLGEESGHHTSGKLCLFSRCGLCGLGVLHRLCRCLGVEEQGQGLAQEILGIHPGVTELVVGVFLHTGDTVLIEELRIVSGITVEEIIRSHTQPEQTNLAVRILGVVVNVRQGGSCKRTVAAQVGKLIQMCQSVGQSLVATT